MVTHPISVPRKIYRGSKDSLRRKANDRNRLAAQLEDYVNRKFVDDGRDEQVFLYGFIAADLGIPQEVVRSILFPVDCGHNGLTVRRSTRR